MHVLIDIGHSLREGFFMFWETLWALVLGFTLSGVVQAFVSKDQLQRVLGDHRPAALARATGFGMVSSSCSYAASAMAKSLFQKGADFIAAMKSAPFWNSDFDIADAAYEHDDETIP